MESQKERYLNQRLNEEWPPMNLRDLEIPHLEQHLRSLINATNRDGTPRINPPEPAALVPMPNLISAVRSDLDPFKDYTNDPVDKCAHCNFPIGQCLETLYGDQMSHYYKRAAIKEGVIYYLDNEDEPEEAVRENFKHLLTQLKFTTAVMNGTPLPEYPGDGQNPYLQGRQNCQDTPLPRCIIDGSCAKFFSWLEDQQEVHQWGYDINEGMSLDDVTYPLSVINFYREALQNVP